MIENFNLFFKKGNPLNVSYYLLSDNIYKSNKKYKSNKELLQIILEEKIKKISSYYPTEFTNPTIVRIGIRIESNIIAVFEITGPDNINNSYITTLEEN